MGVLDMIINVTLEDIAVALSTDKNAFVSRSCPVYQALKRNGFKNISVSAFVAHIEGKTIWLPKKVHKVTRASRQDWNLIKPFSFKLNVKALTHEPNTTSN